MDEDWITIQCVHILTGTTAEREKEEAEESGDNAEGSPCKGR